MLRPDIAEVFDYVTSRCASYSLNTNGTLITAAIARVMKRPGVKMVSLYCAAADVHDRITRTPGSFAAVAALARRREEYLRRTRDFCRRFSGPPGDVLFECGASHDACINAYGKAQMCLTLRHPETVVDLRGPDGAFEAARLRQAFADDFPRLRALRATNADCRGRCARCFLKGLCEQCPARSWSEHGTLDTPVEYLCEVTHEQARTLGLLGPGEHTWEIEDWKERVERL